jgi:hypothetical protein
MTGGNGRRSWLAICSGRGTIADAYAQTPNPRTGQSLSRGGNREAFYGFRPSLDGFGGASDVAVSLAVSPLCSASLCQARRVLNDRFLQIKRSRQGNDRKLAVGERQAEERRGIDMILPLYAERPA